VKEDEMARACTTHGREEKCIYDLGGGSLKQRGHWEDLDVGVRIILKWILEI
jgi:hypothetical protein